MASSAEFKQDMPPKGGYQKIEWWRIAPKTVFSNGKLLTLYATAFFIGYLAHQDNKRWRKKIDYECHDHLIALQPLYKAEQDRLYLRTLRANRDEERELMKDVPGWIVGTYYGVPVYKTYDTQKHLPETHFNEFYAHRPHLEIQEHCWPGKWI